MKTLVITGASSGIGKATAELFAARGYKVYNLSRHGESTPQIVHIPCDVTDEEQVQQTIRQIIGQEGRIDVLVSNAGCGISGAIEFTASAEMEHQMRVNFFGTVNVVKAVLPYMRQQQSGRIVLMSSVAAVLPIPYQAFYSASKAAVNAYGLALRNEVAEFGIRVSVMMPGDVQSGFTKAREKNIQGTDVYTHLQNAVATMERDEQNGMSTMAIARKLWRIAGRRCPAPLYTAGVQYHLFVFLERVLPKRLSNWIVRLLYS